MRDHFDRGPRRSSVVELSAFNLERRILNPERDHLFPIDSARLVLLSSSPYAGIAQLVEHNLAKVGVAGSNPVSRSIAWPRGLRLVAATPFTFAAEGHGSG